MTNYLVVVAATPEIKYQLFFNPNLICGEKQGYLIATDPYKTIW